MATSTIYSLEGKNLKLTSREDIEQYIKEINEVEDLQEIHLGGNTLGVGACQALGDALKTKKNLRVADFADIFTGRLITEIPDALRALCDSLVDHTSLEEINLSDNAFGGRSAEPMVNFLTHNHHFSILKLNNNGMGIQGGKIIATALIEAASELEKLGLPSKLKTVICGRNRLEDGSASTWSKAYSLHPNLEEVRMFQNGIRMDGIIAITQGLSNCPNLKILDLQDNTATLRGSRGIAAALPKWTKLEVLNLSDCLLKPKGGYLVIDALGKGSNGSLKTLQLQYCDLDRKALDSLGKVIEGGAIKELEKLDINGNWADEEDECIERIKKGLEKYGHEDGLDELDEMDPDGEDDDEEEGEEEEKEESEEEEGKEVEEDAPKVAEQKEEGDTNLSEVAAAAVAVPVGAAAAAVASTGLVSSAEDNPTVKEDTNEGKETAVTDSKVEKEEPIEAVEGKEKVDDASEENEEAKAKDADGTGEKAAENEKDKKTEGASTSEVAAAAIAVPAATATVVGAGVAAAVANSKETVDSKMDDLDVSSPEPKPQDKQEFAPTKDLTEVIESKEFPATTTSAKEDEKVAENAAEVAESAQEVPEEKEAAESAAEVSKSAEAVHAVEAQKQTEERHDAQVADDVSKEAEKAGVNDAVEAQDTMEKDEGERKEAAVTADQVADSAQKLHAKDDKKQEDELTDMMAATQISSTPASPKGGKKHAKNDSVDLSGELYANDANLRSSAAAAAASSSTTSDDASPQAATPDPPKKKSGFRAAMGAVRELLR